MTRIGVLSDSHGAMDNLTKAISEMKNCDVIVHLGDHAQDAESLQVNVLSVCGNCDWFSNAPVHRVMEAEGRKILLTHGHREGVKLSLSRLAYAAEEAGATIALYGHTHIAASAQDGSIYLINPGAVKDGRYAIVELDGDKVTTNLMRL